MNGRESEGAVEPREGASRRMSFRVHDGVDALEARRACGGSFSSRSYVDRKTFHITSPLDAQRAIVGEGSQEGFAAERATPRSEFFPVFREIASEIASSRASTHVVVLFSPRASGHTERS